MSSNAALAERLFRMPGDPGRATSHLLAQAAAAHAKLLYLASTADRWPCDGIYRAFEEFLKGPAAAADKRTLLDYPPLIEGLHTLSPGCRGLTDWDNTVAPRRVSENGPVRMAAGRAKMGNLSLALLLREAPSWCGHIDVCTDVYGRLRFPFSDWSITLCVRSASGQEMLTDQVVSVSLNGKEARWCLADEGQTPFMIVSRDDFLRLVLESDGRLEIHRMTFPHPYVKPRLQFASTLGSSSIRYDPIGFENLSTHAGLTGAILAALVDAVRMNSPAIYAELCMCIRSIRGFELPVSKFGVIESFSTQMLPGVMGFNVPYSSQGEPRLNPFCFAWLAHELAHTKHYLIDNVGYLHHHSFLMNPEEMTGEIARYRRQLSVRTLFQLPYVHLYEWVMLMDFIEGQFRGLPWRMTDDSIAFGEDLICEITESFELINRYARLTPLATAVIAHLRRLCRVADRRWQRILSRHHQ